MGESIVKESAGLTVLLKKGTNVLKSNPHSLEHLTCSELEPWPHDLSPD